MRWFAALLIAVLAVGAAGHALLSEQQGSWWTAVVLLVILPVVGALAYTIVHDGWRSLRALTRR